MTIASLIVDVLANTVKLRKDVEDVNKSLSTIENVAKNVGKALAATFTIAAAGQAARELLDYADGVVNVAEKTKFSTDAVQELTLAFQPHGIAIDAVATANEKLSKNLIGGDKSTVAALQKMGLNVSQLKTLAPDQLFITVADAVGKIKNPAEQAYAAMTIFGKGGQELLGGLDGHLKETTQSFKDMGLVIDEKTIKAADDFGDQLGLMGKQFLGIVATVLGPLLPALSALGNILTWIGNHVIGPILNVAIKFAISILGAFYTVIADVLGGLLSLGAKLPGGVGKKFAEMADAVKSSSAATTKYINGLWKETDKVAESTPKAAVSLKGFGGDLEDAARRAKEFKEALAAYTSVGQSYQNTVDRLSGATVDGIRYDLARGQSQEVLQKIYGVTAEQIKAIIEVTKQEQAIEAAAAANRATIGKEAERIFADRVQKQIDALHLEQDAILENRRVAEQLQTEHGDFIRKTSLNTFDYQRAQLDDWINDQEGALDYSKDNWIDAYNAIHQVAGDRLQNIVDAEYAAFQEMKAQEKTWANGFKGLLDGIPGLLQKAFTGGGGLGGFAQALTSGLGSMAGDQLITGPLTSLFNHAAPALSNTLGMTLTTAIGGAIPFIGPAIGALAGPLISGIKKLFGGPSEEELGARTAFSKVQLAGEDLTATINRLTSALMKTGKTGPEALAMVQRVLDATHISAQAVESAMQGINDTIGSHQKDQEDLQAAVERYKFSIEELGPAMQAQQLDAQAQQLAKDWQLLVGSNMNMAVVNEHMASSMNDYLQHAVKTGQDVPMAMQPIIQSMIDQGLFLDANGDKITDIKDLGVTFSMTTTEGFKLVADKLQTLLEKLGLVPSAMDAMKGSGVDAANAVADAIKKIPKVHETVFTVAGGTPATASAAAGAVTQTASKLDEWYRLPFDTRIHTTFDEWIKTHSASTGGLVTASGIQHLAAGGVVLPFTPKGIDTVPIMGAPGEGMVNRTGMSILGVDGLGALNNGHAPRMGGGSVTTVIDFSEMKRELQELRKQQATQNAHARRLPGQLAAAITSALVQSRAARR